MVIGEGAVCCLPREEHGSARVSRSACEGLGGEIVSDIGNADVHGSDYVCPRTQKAPVASIVADDPALGGGVCCK